MKVLIIVLALSLTGAETKAGEIKLYPKHLYESISKTLTTLGELSPIKPSRSAQELLFMTAAVESNCGYYWRQKEDGPAIGIFQMEPNTIDFLWNNYLVRRHDLRSALLSIATGYYRPMSAALTRRIGIDVIRVVRDNVAFQIALARVNYYRIPKALPKAHDIDALAKYWKKYWNTAHGEGRVDDAIDKYFHYESWIGKFGEF